MLAKGEHSIICVPKCLKRHAHIYINMKITDAFAGMQYLLCSWDDIKQFFCVSCMALAKAIFLYFCVNAAQTGQCVKMLYGWGNKQLSKKDRVFPYGQVEQGARRQSCLSEQRAAMPTKAGDAPTQDTQLQPSSAETKIPSHLCLSQVRYFCPAQLPVSASAWH